MNSPAAAARRAAAMAGMLSLAALAAACATATSPSNRASASSGAATSSASASTPASASTSASPTSPGPALAGCATGFLTAAVDVAASNGAAGSVYYPINFTNVSDRACTLYGFPGVSFVTGPDGSQIGSPASRNTALAATTVTLAPGAVAHATLQVSEAANYDPAQCRPVTAHWLKIFPPDQTAALYTRLTAQVCSGVLPGQLGAQTRVYAIRAGAGTGASP